MTNDHATVRFYGKLRTREGEVCWVTPAAIVGARACNGDGQPVGDLSPSYYVDAADCEQPEIFKSLDEALLYYQQRSGLVGAGFCLLRIRQQTIGCATTSGSYPKTGSSQDDAVEGAGE